MSNVIIKKGHHYSNEWPLSLWFCKQNKQIAKQVTFTSSCRYFIGEDQTDKNKLFGWSYGFHHKNSVRVGWFFNYQTSKIEVCLYVYTAGVLSKSKTIECEINTPYNITLSSDINGYNINYTLNVQKVQFLNEASNMESVSYNAVAKLPKWGYKLTAYFGGNRTAPHDINIEYAK